MSRDAAPDPGHGFVRALSVRKIGDSGLQHAITAKPEEMARIATFLDVLAVHDLRADFRISRWRGRGLKLEGHLAARVVQACVVTLEPVENVMDVSFERRYLPADMLDHEDGGDDIFVDPEGEDPPEPLGHEIDLGEAVVEEMALNLEPYPRKPGIVFAEQPEAATPAAPNPFAALAKLKPRRPPSG
jgi:uncharacterized metal-binding protein YceD (DUF177 family)